MDTILLPTNDVVFKRLFGSESNIDILTAFLQSILDIPPDEYEEISIMDPEFKMEYEDDKTSILDIKIKTKNNNVINCEMQVLPYEFMDKRITYYTAKMLTNQMYKGYDYDKMKKAINITILDFNMIGQNNEYSHTFKLCDMKNGVVLSDDVEIHTLELKKLPQQSDQTKLYDWLSFFKSKNKEEFDMIAKNNTEIQKAVVRLVELSSDQETRMLAEEREKKLRDERSRLNASRNRGLEEGREEGKKEAQINIAKKLLLSGADKNHIMELTSISESDLNNIIELLENESKDNLKFNL